MQHKPNKVIKQEYGIKGKIKLIKHWNKLKNKNNYYLVTGINYTK